MRKLAILTFFLFPFFAFGQKWSQVEFKNNDGKSEKKWFYKVSGKFKDYEQQGWLDNVQPDFKIKPVEVSVHVFNNGTINFYFVEKNEKVVSTFLTESKSNPIKKKKQWTINVKTSKNSPVSKFIVSKCWGSRNCLFFSYPSQQKKFLELISNGFIVCQIEHDKRAYTWPIAKLTSNQASQKKPKKRLNIRLEI